MVPDIVFQILKYGFLIILYIFLFFALRTVYVEVLPADRRQRATAKPARASKLKKAHLHVVQTEEKIASKFPLEDVLTVGRGENCAVCLEDNYVSSSHAKFYPGNGRFFVEDMGSTNGTYVNGRRISYPTELRQGDRIKIGKTIFEFRS